VTTCIAQWRETGNMTRRMERKNQRTTLVKLKGITTTHYFVGKIETHISLGLPLNTQGCHIPQRMNSLIFPDKFAIRNVKTISTN
jgi:hypothetical protein